MLPFADGVRPGPEDPDATDNFFGAMKRQRFDLALQLHGGGRYSNPFLRRFGARHTVGTRTPDAVPLERTLPYAYYQHEPLRALEVAGLAGAAPVGLEAQLRPLASSVPAPRRCWGTARYRGTGPGRPDPLAPRPASWWSIRGQRIRAGAGRPPVSPRWQRRARQMAARCSWWATPASATLQRTWSGPRARKTSGPSPAKPTSAPWPRCWRGVTSWWPTTAVRGTWLRPWERPQWGFTGQGTPSTPVPWAAACTACTSPGSRTARSAERTSPRWAGPPRDAAMTARWCPGSARRLFTRTFGRSGP